MSATTKNGQDLAAYLGDGAYVRTDGYVLTLYTTDGARVTNEVHLEPEHIDRMLMFLSEHCRFTIEVKK